MKIAVIGSGISGLSSAYFLSKHHKVDLYEQNDHFGGHSYTYDIKEEDKIVPVDLGFIVFNELTYPNLINFFNEQLMYYENFKAIYLISAVIVGFTFYIFIALLIKAFKKSDINLNY